MPTTLVNTTPTNTSAAKASASPAAHATACLSRIASMAALSSLLICTIFSATPACANKDWDGERSRDAFDCEVSQFHPNCSLTKRGENAPSRARSAARAHPLRTATKPEVGSGPRALALIPPLRYEAAGRSWKIQSAMSAGNPVAIFGKCTAGSIKPMGVLRMKPTTTVRWVSALPHMIVSAKQVHSPHPDGLVTRCRSLESKQPAAASLVPSTTPLPLPSRSGDAVARFVLCMKEVFEGSSPLAPSSPKPDVVPQLA